MLPMVAQSQSSPGPINWKDRCVTLAQNDQLNPQIARPDTSTYTVIVWEDARNGGLDIYAQVVENGHGLALWNPIEGVPVCTVTGDQKNPRAAFDQGNDVIIVWEDYRSGDAEIYAHRIDLTTGQFDPNWSANPDGKPVCTGTDSTTVRPRIVGTGDGAFITWTDYRNVVPPDFNIDIYLQYIMSANGNPKQGWPTNGIRANQSQYERQVNSEIVLDTPPRQGSDPGVVVVWEDSRDNTGADIYAGLVDITSGSVVTTSPWQTDGRRQKSDAKC